MNCSLTQILTVSEINERIKGRLDADPRLHDLWAKGELSNVTNHRSGHRYFTLKDRECQLSCVLFRNHGSRLDFDLKDGQNVLVFGDVDVYRPHGRVQLIARGIKLNTGLGFRHLEFEALKKKLSSEGLFDLERKRPLPKYPKCIGIVTSPDGAALRDVLRIMGSYPARIILSPAQVQGQGASESIAQAIAALWGRADVVIVCRGGGSIEDLWCFNSEVVARAIFECDSPVISAVGHETDVTIADFVADVRAATPTAAAEMAVPDMEVIRTDLHLISTRMVRALWSSLERRQERLEYLERGVSARKMYTLLGEARQRLDYLGERLGGAQQDQLDALRSRLEMAESRLSSVSPLNTLGRGYCIVRSSRRIVTGVGDVMPGDILEIVLSDGTLRCRVLSDGEGIDGDGMGGEGMGSDGVNSEGTDNEKGEFSDSEG
jgi:exodeoxyribonuclease VII large subunit